jgi:hypothetical protein
MPLMFFLFSRLGQRTGIYYIDSTALPVCHNRRISRHKTFEGLAARGKTSMGWFFGFKLHLVFNQLNEIVALKLTAGNVADTKATPSLTKTLVGKLFGDKGYIGKELAQQLLRRGLALFTRVRKNMKSLPLSITEVRALMNAQHPHIRAVSWVRKFSLVCCLLNRGQNSATTRMTQLSQPELVPSSPLERRDIIDESPEGSSRRFFRLGSLRRDQTHDRSSGKSFTN